MERTCEERKRKCFPVKKFKLHFPKSSAKQNYKSAHMILYVILVPLTSNQSHLFPISTLPINNQLSSGNLAAGVMLVCS